MTKNCLEVFRSLTEEQACERTFVDAHPAALCFTTDTNRLVFGGKACFADRSVYYCEIDGLAEHRSLATIKRNCGTYRVVDHDNNFSASLIQYLVGHGRKVVQIYVHYQEEGAVYEVRTCSVNEDNVGGAFGPWQLVNRTIEGMAIDSHLDETSANAVQNAAVTNEIRSFEQHVEDELGNAAAEMAGVISTVGKEVENAKTATQRATASGEQAMSCAKYATEKAGEAAMAAHDADEAAKAATTASNMAKSASQQANMAAGYAQGAYLDAMTALVNVNKAADEAKSATEAANAATAANNAIAAEMTAKANQAAADASEAKQAAQSAVEAELHEAERVEAEAKREAAEEQRLANEVHREDNETAREAAEANRKEAEAVRYTQEDLRQSNEFARKDAEKERELAEYRRKQNETYRQERETVRDKNASEAAEKATEAVTKAEEAVSATQEAVAKADASATAAEEAAESANTAAGNANRAMENIEAPKDGQAYNRKNGAWEVAQGGMTPEEREELTELGQSAVKIIVVSTTSDQVFKLAEPFVLIYLGMKGVEFRQLFGEYENLLRLDHFTNGTINTDPISKDLYSVIEFGLMSGIGYLRGWVDVKNGKLFAKNQRDEVDLLMGYNYEQFAANIETLFGGGMTDEEREKLTELDQKVSELAAAVGVANEELETIIG